MIITKSNVADVMRMTGFVIAKFSNGVYMFHTGCGWSDNIEAAGNYIRRCDAEHIIFMNDDIFTDCRVYDANQFDVQHFIDELTDL